MAQVELQCTVIFSPCALFDCRTGREKLMLIIVNDEIQIILNIFLSVYESHNHCMFVYLYKSIDNLYLWLRPPAVLDMACWMTVPNAAFVATSHTSGDALVRVTLK